MFAADFNLHLYPLTSKTKNKEGTYLYGSCIVELKAHLCTLIRKIRSNRVVGGEDEDLCLSRF